MSCPYFCVNEKPARSGDLAGTFIWPSKGGLERIPSPLIVRPFGKLMVLSEVEAQAHYKWERARKRVKANLIEDINYSTSL